MSEAHGQTQGNDKPGLYEFRLKGHLDARWIDWFAGLSLTRESDGTTILTVQAVDQPALHGLLRKVRDLGMPLVSVIQIDSELSNQQNNRSSMVPNSMSNGGRWRNDGNEDLQRKFSPR